MSFISDAYNFITGNSIGGQLARTALTAFTLNRVTASINRDNEARLAETGTNSATIDLGTRVQVNPNSEAHIPVLYGSTWTGGTITDAHISDDNLTMTVVITICEKTGVVYSTGNPSTTNLLFVNINELLLNFASDGFTVASATDNDGNSFDNWAGLIKVWFYDGNSESPRALYRYEDTQDSLEPAYNRMPNWNSSYMMENLVFAVCQVTYSAENDIRGLPDFKFQLVNTILQPGDALLDYMTADIYGAGIDPGDIRVT